VKMAFLVDPNSTEILSSLRKLCLRSLVAARLGCKEELANRQAYQLLYEIPTYCDTNY